jgi:hypothetical protein
MPTYPSSLYKGVSPSSLGTNVAGSIAIDNVANYQELKNTVTGFGPGSGAGGGNTTVIVFNSAAKYATDNIIGTTGLGTSTYIDFDTAQTNMSSAISAYTTAVTSITAVEKSIAVAYSGITYNNLQSKLEKVTYELNRLAADITLVSAGTAVSTDFISRYPSSRNRYTNTAGGI